jgi:hypothetical protein
MMDNTTWYQGKRLKSFIEHGTGGAIKLPHLAVAAILAAREQGLTLDDIVHQLILANHFDAATKKFDREQALRDLGY